MHTYIGIDLGTSVIKITAINDDGIVIASVSLPNTLITPSSGDAEQDPVVWWKVTVKLLQKLHKQISFQNVNGIGLSGQMHGLVAYDAKKIPVHNAIVWLDKRSQKEVDDMQKTLGKSTIYTITGNPLFTGFLLPSLMWMRAHTPTIYKKIVTVSSPKDYLAYRLTNVLRTEPTDALATGAFDYKKNMWSEQMITAAGLKPSLFPPIAPTKNAYGVITKKVAAETGLPIGIPVYGGSDQSMSAMGLGLIEESHGSIAISTGGQFLAVAKKGILDKKQRLHTLNHALEGVGLYMAATLTAGLSLQWFKDNIINPKYTYEALLEDTAAVKPGSNGLFFFPFLAGERTPYFNTNLKGAFIGLSLLHTRAHMTRAIIEGVCFSMRACFQVFRDNAISLKKITISGGGTKHTIWKNTLVAVVNKPMGTI
nr:xylulokinase [Candidatus Levybacteria bacterium]